MEEEVEPSLESTAEGYDEAVENGVPFTAEQEINAWESADPVSVTEAEPSSRRDRFAGIRSRLATRHNYASPDITSSAVEASNTSKKLRRWSKMKSLLQRPPADEAETSAPAVSEDAASGGSTDDDENQ